MFGRMESEREAGRIVVLGSEQTSAERHVGASSRRGDGYLGGTRGALVRARGRAHARLAPRTEAAHPVGRGPGAPPTATARSGTLTVYVRGCETATETVARLRFGCETAVQRGKKSKRNAKHRSSRAPSDPRATSRCHAGFRLAHRAVPL